MGDVFEGVVDKNIRDVFVNIDKVRVTALCDVYEDKMDEVGAIVNDKHNYTPEKFANWKELIDSDKVDAVVVTASWETHIEPAIYAMKKGKPVGIEVGGAYSVEECWDLVRTWEETKTPFMMLENCCYGKRELMVTNMVEKGFFGEIVHCEGAYAHDLRNEISFGKENTIEEVDYVVDTLKSTIQRLREMSPLYNQKEI